MCKLQDDGGDGDSIYGRINQMLPVLESQISCMFLHVFSVEGGLTKDHS
jgi:hypothetical protein